MSYWSSHITQKMCLTLPKLKDLLCTDAKFFKTGTGTSTPPPLLIMSSCVATSLHHLCWKPRQSNHTHFLCGTASPPPPPCWPFLPGGFFFMLVNRKKNELFSRCNFLHRFSSCFSSETEQICLADAVPSEPFFLVQSTPTCAAFFFFMWPGANRFFF